MGVNLEQGGTNIFNLVLDEPKVASKQKKDLIFDPLKAIKDHWFMISLHISFEGAFGYGAGSTSRKIASIKILSPRLMKDFVQNSKAGKERGRIALYEIASEFEEGSAKKGFRNLMYAATIFGGLPQNVKELSEGHRETVVLELNNHVATNNFEELTAEELIAEADDLVLLKFVSPAAFVHACEDNPTIKSSIESALKGSEEMQLSQRIRLSARFRLLFTADFEKLEFDKQFWADAAKIFEVDTKEDSSLPYKLLGIATDLRIIAAENAQLGKRGITVWDSKPEQQAIHKLPTERSF